MQGLCFFLKLSYYVNFSIKKQNGFSIIIFSPSALKTLSDFAELAKQLERAKVNYFVCEYFKIILSDSISFISICFFFYLCFTLL